MIHDVLRRFAFRVMASRPPDFVVGADDPRGAYLNRWYVLPRNRLFNVYAHEFLRSDDDRALHDHPWFNLSVLVDGAYREHTVARGGINRWRLRRAGTWSGVKLRSPWSARRVELLSQLLLHPSCECAEHFEVGDPECPRCLGTGRTKIEVPCRTLFVTGPRMRRWGFHCRLGWVDFEKFVKKVPGGNGIGAGCGELE